MENITINEFLETDLGNVSPNPRGPYALDTEYEYLDLVEYQGGSYLCTVDLGQTITGIAPEPGETSAQWQLLTLPGSLTPEYIAMHDRVANMADQVSTDRTATELAKDDAEAAKADVSRMHQDITRMAADTEAAKDSAAGYAQGAEVSRKAAEAANQSAQDLAAAFPATVQAGVQTIETARQQAVGVVKTQEAESRQHVIDSTADYINQETAAAQESIANTRDGVVQDVQRAGENTKTAAVAAVNSAGTAQQTQITDLSATERQEISLTAAEHLVEIDAAAAQLEIDFGELLDRDAQHVDIDSVRNLHHTATAEGDGHVTIQGAAGFPEQISINGKHEQPTTTGAQLWNGVYKNNLTGLTIKSDTLCKLTMSGNTIDSSAADLYIMGYYGNKGDLGLRGDITISIDSSEEISALHNETVLKNARGAITVTSTDDVPISCIMMRFPKNTEVNKTISIMVNQGSTALPWEPYTGNKPSPNIDYPQPIHAVGESGSLDITACGKNLADVSQVKNVSGRDVYGKVDNGYILKADTADNRISVIPCRLKKGVTYRLSIDTEIFNPDNFEKPAIYAYLPELEQYNIYHSGGFTPKEDVTKIGIYIGAGYVGKNITAKITNMQVELGDTATDYEPYHGKSITIHLEKPMYNGDKICRQDGKWGVLRINNKIEDGAVWTMSNISPGTVGKRFGFYAKDIKAKKYAGAICSHFVKNDVPSYSSEGTYLSTSESSNGFIYIRTEDDFQATSAEEFNAWAKNNNLVVVYELETPLFEPFPPSVQRDLNNLYTYPGCTTIICTDPLNPYLSVEYVLDKDTIPESTQTYVDATTKDRIERIAFTGQAEGTGMIHVEDSAPWEVLSLDTYGQTEQRTTTGAQLFNASKLTGNATISGSEITVREKQQYGNANAEIPIDIVTGKTIKLSGKIKSNANTEAIVGIQCVVTKADGKTEYHQYTGPAFSIPEDVKRVRVGLYVNNSPVDLETENTVVFSDVMLNIGSTALPWEPYTGNKPSPSPDYPQEPVSKTIDKIEVGDGGYLMRGSYFNNVQKLPLIKGCKYRIHYGGNDAGNAVNAFLLCENKTFAHSAELYNHGDSAKGLKNVNTTGKATGECRLPINGNAEYSLDVLADGLYLYQAVNVESKNTDNAWIAYDYTYSATAEPNKPYTAQTVTLSQPVTLHGLPVTSGGNITIAGQQYAADQLEKQDILRLCTVAHITGLEEIIVTTFNGANRFAIKNVFKNPVHGGIGMCSHFAYGSNPLNYNDADNMICVYEGDNNCYLRCDTYTTVDELKTWMKSNDVTLIMRLKTPVLEPLPATDQAALNALETYYDTTNIINSANAYMTAKYIRSINHAMLDITEQLVDMQAQIDQLALSTNNI